MPIVSQLAQTVFLALVAAVALMLVIATRKAAPRVEVGTITSRWTIRSLVVLAAWLGIPALLARAGWLTRFTAMPPPLMVMMLVIFAATTWLAYSDLGTRLVNGIEIQWLIGFQFFRAPLEWLLHRLFQEGVIPVQMTYAGRNFDIVTGLLALLILFWASATKLPRWAIVAFNVIGLVLLVNIVSVAIFCLRLCRSGNFITNRPIRLSPISLTCGCLRFWCRQHGLDICLCFAGCEQIDETRQSS